ncbi:UvrD-helicase domain-containing protein [Zwartia sp.]|uniref:UvrD-helicase domain-containing protein n=1 Tax=Zwartia sp. TaxID=2978004 RepID=UPI003BAFBE40
MTEKIPHDAAVRARAIDPRQSFLVQAPAGSGKTELLTDRILALLATVNRPEEIVAITFTRKAAAEMHERVLQKLVAGLAVDPPDKMHARKSWELARLALARDQEMGWQILQHPARLSIRTIDAFCASLVRTMPWLSSMGGLPGVVDDARPHYLAAARMTLDLADQQEFVCVTDLLKHLDLDIEVAADALADMLGQRDQWLPLLEKGDDRDLLELNLQTAIEADLSRLSSLMPIGWAEQLAPVARMAAAALSETHAEHALTDLLDWEGESFGAEVEYLAQWRALADLLLTGSGTLRRALNKNNGCPPQSQQKKLLQEWLASHESDEPAAWIERLFAIVETPDPAFSDEQWHILSAQIKCLWIASAQLMVQFAQAGEVDFIEIARRADQALGRSDDPSELLLKLDAGIRHLLIDEFQDTSQSQIDLLKKITSGWQTHDGRTLFLVGDPMQSIYRFRKADVALFLKIRDHGLADLRVESLQLTDNFRSQAGVVNWVNTTFSKLLPAEDEPAAGAISYAPSQAFHPLSLDPAVSFHPVFVQSGAKAEAVVVDLVREALEMYPDKQHPVAVLVRARTHLKEVTQLLSLAGIACRAVELVPLYKRPFVVDLVQIIRALSHPGDRAAWVSVLRSPYCGLTLKSLHALVSEDRLEAVPAILERALKISSTGNVCHAEQVLEPDEYARLMATAPILLRALKEDDIRPLANMIERVWRLLGGPALAQGAGDLQDAERVFQLVEQMAPYGGLDLDALESKLEKLFAAPDSESRAVEVMTMHKSKGLQFERVILFGLHHAPRSDQSPLVRIEQIDEHVMFGPIKPRASSDADVFSKYLGSREKRRAAFEVDRLLYVAATRAKESLHLVAEVKLDKKTGLLADPVSGSLLGRLWSHVQKPEVPQGLQIPDEVASDRPVLTGQPLRRRLHIPPAFPLHLDAPRNAAYAWRDSTTFDREVGILVHAWLAHIGEQGLAGWSPEAVLEKSSLIHRQLTQAGLPVSQAGLAVTEVTDTLVAMLTRERGRWLLSHPQSYREWTLMDAAGKVSVIDLALADEQGWLVVDYKTGRPGQGEAHVNFVQRMHERYAPQLERYCQQLTDLDGRSARAALYFPRDDLWIPLNSD